MRRALSRILESLAFNSICAWVVEVLGTIVFTIAGCVYFNTSYKSFAGLVIEIVSLIISFVIYALISIIFSVIAEWLS